ncbi:MAG: leucine-responsive transcriptional regulator Lrp [Pseudomonadales bacterium]|nr:leucine-responsive transcriptional regulator Lrp [Pseudomonadales bacterium]MBO6565213.1 leucine-responsive transcriptional regulator Lrp [Pseudomonadales bacterium]MBO6595163.1 leucine-responsive transcriptional regulator Lrp [Pseudomonadales bacterium]MBO6701669.1 leucine-responsive transcriptional regulator Lrp [Pseudomonadales bacterium]MBO6821278.1 leucine-responsive transcriptional regulator Lrp [Pseudomonadales bacterium]
MNNGEFGGLKVGELAGQQSKTLDKIDLNILRELQLDGRIKNTELASRVGLSATPCAERVRNLEKLGYIQGYNARLNPKLLDLELLVFVEISLIRTSPDVFEEFRLSVIDLPEVLECHLVSGNFDYLLKARVADMAAYRQLLGETLLTLPGVSESRTYVVMEEVKEQQTLPV